MERATREISEMDEAEVVEDRSERVLKGFYVIFTL